MDTEDADYREWLEWLHHKTPIVLEGGHRAGVSRGDVKDQKGVPVVWWVHECRLGGKQRPVLGHIDVHTGERHRLISEDPLHLEPSLVCSDCGDHGFVRDGKWISV